MSNRMKALLLDLLARVVAVAPPAVVTLCQFPLWVNRSAGATVSGIGFFALMLCMIPFWRKAKDIKRFIADASTPELWLILLCVFLLLSQIADSVVYISIAGLAGSLGSMVVSGFGKRYREGG